MYEVFSQQLMKSKFREHTFNRNFTYINMKIGNLTPNIKRPEIINKTQVNNIKYANSTDANKFKCNYCPKYFIEQTGR